MQLVDFIILFSLKDPITIQNCDGLYCHGGCQITAMIAHAWGHPSFLVSMAPGFYHDMQIAIMFRQQARHHHTTVVSFTKEVNPRLAKRPLVSNGRLANRGLTSLVKETTGDCLLLRVSENGGNSHVSHELMVHCSLSSVHRTYGNPSLYLDHPITQAMTPVSHASHPTGSSTANRLRLCSSLGAVNNHEPQYTSRFVEGGRAAMLDLSLST